MSFSSSIKLNSMPALWREFCAVVWMRKKLGIFWFSLIILSGIGVMSKITPLYESSIKILVSPQDLPVRNNSESELAAASQIDYEIELLKNQELLMSVAQQAGSNILQKFSARILVQEVNHSNVIKVTYCDENPEQSVRVLNLLFEQYRKHRDHLNHLINLDSTQTALKEKTADFTKKSDAATISLKRLDAADELTGVTRQNFALRQYDELQKQAEMAALEKHEAQKQIKTLKSQLATEPEQLEVGSATKYVQALDKMKEDLVAFEMQRTQLLQKYQPQHRLIHDIDQRIAKSKELIAKEEQNPPRERSFAINQTRRRLTDDLFKAETTLAVLSEREVRLRELVNGYQSRVTTLNLQEVKKDSLERERVMNQEAVHLYRQKAQEVEINALVKKSKIPQIRLLEAASVARYPITPNWSRTLLLLLLTGFGASLGSICIAEIFRPRVSSEEGLHRRLGLAVLAKLPAPSAVKLEM